MAISLLAQLFFFFLLSPTITKTKVTHAHIQCLEHERTLLLELKNQLVFNSSYSTKLVKWNQTHDCCKWAGVKCDVAGHVISLKLNDEAISSGFNESSSIFSLKYLKKLNLTNNVLSGPLPHSISNLSELVDVELSNNFFSGSISSIHFEGLYNVESMVLSYNSLSGSIPISIFTLPSLQLLDLHNNKFSGQVPKFPIVNISNLNYLHLSSNRLESPIPNSFFHLPRLTELYMSDNLFNDTFQLRKFLTLPSLKCLILSYNNLSLDITSIPVKQSHLQYFDLSSNKIGGEIPSWIWGIGDGSHLFMNLSCNMLVGLQKPYNIPTGLGVLDLHSNQIQGELPLPPQGAEYLDFSNNQFDKLSPVNGSYSFDNLHFLSVSNNSLSGPFPTFICNSIYLQILDLSVNQFSGNIPPCLFENSEYLQVINLGRNNFSGHIPDNFSHYRKLRTLDLSHNHLVGDVPLSMENCTSLAVMNVGNNHITGNFPCMLPSSLQVLVLRSNNFHGEVICKKKSWPNLQIIDISSNNFTGYLNPFNFSSWRGIKLDSDGKLERNFLGIPTFAFSNYYFWDEVTYRNEVSLTIKGLELKLVKIWPEFTSIDFSCNSFHGHIPQEIGDLTALYLLNLSHNVLAGAIPKSFGKLRQLGSLDLSMNQLIGEIPQEIAGLTFLQVMNVSHNKLVGKIPIGRQIQTFSADSFEGNTGLCGLPLNISCIDTSVASPPNHGIVGSDREIEWDYVFAAAGYVVGLGSFAWVLLFCRSFREKYFEKVEDGFEKIVDLCQHKKRRDRGKRLVRILQAGRQ